MKKIKRWYYKDSDMVKCNLGYGETYQSTQQIVKVRCDQVSEIYLIISNLKKYFKRVFKILYHETELFIFLCAIYGLLIMTAGHYKVLETGSIVNSLLGYIYAFFPVLIIIEVIYNRITQNKFVSYMWVDIVRILTVAFVGSVVLSNTVFNLNTIYSFLIIDFIVELISNLLMLIVNTVVDFIAYYHGKFLWLK